MKEIGDLKAYTVKEVSELLTLHVQTVRKYIKAKKLKATKLGLEYYITENEIKRYFGEE